MAAVADIEGRLRRAFPDAPIEAVDGYDTDGVHIVVYTDRDHFDVSSVVIDRLADCQVDDDIYVYIYVYVRVGDPRTVMAR